MDLPLDRLLLTKEEIPIEHETLFYVPIHPKLLDPNVKLDPNLARDVFPQAANEWYEELQEHVKTLEDGSMKDWINEVYLKEKPEFKEEYGRQVLNSAGWEDSTLARDNGFVSSLSISRNFGGSLYFNNDQGCETYAFFKAFGALKLSKEKAKEFAVKEFDDAVTLRCYGHHNVDHYPGALFLRNWGLLYVNEAMKQAYDQ